MKSHMEMNSHVERSEVNRDRGDVKRPSTELPHIKSMEGRKPEKTRESERTGTELPHIKEKDIQRQNNKEVNEVPKLGGSYRDVKKFSNGETHEVHHMPADSASHLERDDGPAISMEKADHRQTASYGSSREAREYRAQQRELIENGKFEKAMQMDIDDIHDKFGDKYNNAIDQVLDYKEQLKQEGRI